MSRQRRMGYARRARRIDGMACEFARRSGQVDRVVHLRATNEVPEHIYSSQLQAATSFNAESRVKQIANQTLVLSGDADVIVPVRNSLNLAGKIPGATLCIIHGGSHTFFIEQAREFNKIVTEFLGTDFH